MTISTANEPAQHDERAKRGALLSLLSPDERAKRGAQIPHLLPNEELQFLSSERSKLLSLLSPQELATLTCEIFVTMRAAGVPLPPTLQDDVVEAVLEFEHGRRLTLAPSKAAGVAS